MPVRVMEITCYSIGLLVRNWRTVDHCLWGVFLYSQVWPTIIPASCRKWSANRRRRRWRSHWVGDRNHLQR
jgi:hypothetical protein